MPFVLLKTYEHMYISILFSNRDLGEHGHLFEGWGDIPRDNMNKPIPYKYYVSRGEKGDYEFIYKVHQGGLIVNRCMYIQSAELSGTGKKWF